MDFAGPTLEMGRALIAEAHFTQAELEEVLNSEDVRARQALLNQWFPRQPKPHQARSTLANLLSISMLRYGGIIPSVTSGNSLSIPGLPTSRIAIVARTVERRREIAKYLLPSGEAVCAVITEYMIASAGNSAVALSLSTKCMNPSEKAGFVQVTGKKLRAGGKPMRSDFHERSDVVRNLKWLVDSFEAHRHADCNGLQDHLPVMQVGIDLRAINEQYLLIAFRELIGSIPKLSGLNIVPSMIRRSVIVLQTLSSVDGSLSAALANQSKPINKIYNHIFPILVQKDIKMREYINHFETLLLVISAERNDLHGYEETELNARRGTLQQTGFGTLCKNIYGRPGNQGEPCTEPRCAVDMCPQMDIRLHPSNVALLLAWKEALIEAEPEWERDRAERWNEIWLPFLCLINVVQEKSSRGALLAAWDAGTEFLYQLKSQPGFKGPRLW
ncbi:hypothetical protein MW290_22010 [Aquincola tertiaricarbonis]|uniref:Uncharacterized protein n=1 Tax=Aquincola tertiaricarbonis TaxID=391953 RepID=A0ABY4SKU0_AQUTE|nr:hypothetical protein [Aquincola tertiaricarbonis]URI11616.1 hypothetical protein MW290_22010 [Aquincola tertiaricarbonis]